ncbi:hypothetical protein PMKS-001351 [Pichia membranifaciens]|uniref:Cation/H+ exchanger transmembrane domain-containing protein n=1 Tax=Pichia membranifaciens TaxID=4926 RepID=A0A1Q2YER4_9ASCO|nr:hypothetical protein PMKS-001351 [Pichia membranifaciens]
MAVPFGLGCACAVGLWNDYRVHVEELPKIKFTTFMVFIATAMCITAFPVLVRILTELRLVKDRVGTVVLAAGITNDLLGWILLALSITLANASQSIVTLYIVLVAIAWCLFICFPVRIALHFVLKNVMKEFDNPNSPSRTAMLILLLMMFASSFFTDIIGVHPIFGAFIVGTIVPRENNYMISLTSRIEDLVNIIFIPVYFAVAGLDVDLGLLNRGLDWGWAFGLIGVAMVGKIFGGTISAKLRGLYWRESATVGVLMSCKGIVEIVVLQVGLNAKIISKKTYSMFIFMALATTFFTTPLTLYSYPNSYREKVQTWLAEKEKMGSKDTAAGLVDGENGTANVTRNAKIDKIILSVENVESVSNGLLLLDIFLEIMKVPVHAINLKTLTERTADLLHASMMDDLTPDHSFNSLNSILSIFKIFCHFNRIPFTSEILYSLPESYIQTLLDNPSFSSDDLLILPISRRQFSVDFLSDMIRESKRESKEYNFRKAIFINNTQELSSKPESESENDNEHSKNISIKKDVDNEKSKESSNSETKSYFSEDTILNASSLLISTVTLYISNPELTDQDRLGMKLFDILIRRKDLIIANVVLSNIENNSKTYDIISSWLASDEETFRNVHLSLETLKAPAEPAHSGKGADLDSLVIVSTEDNLELVTSLVETHKKVFVLF